MSKWWKENSVWITISITILLIIAIWIAFTFFDDDIKNNKDLIQSAGFSLFGKKIDKKKRVAIKESKGELACKEAAQRIFRKKFIKVRPDYLRNEETGHNLELDVFNEEIGLAIEYSGQQHYKYIPYFHKNYEAYLKQVKRDEMKERKCKEKGIKLIVVPYTVKIEDIEDFILQESKKLGLIEE